MTALALISALGTALCVGYYVGRRAGSKPSTWKKRTSRVALGRLAINLLMLMTARRIRQSLQAGRVFADAGGIWGLRTIEPLGLLRGSVARLRSY
jgi:drug/metabolite transporter superfamily protein YnfA